MLNNLLYVTMKNNICSAIKDNNIDLLLSYEVIVYNYWEMGWFSLEEKIELYDLIVYNVKLLLESKI
jgi:hypothetical protein